MPKPETTNKMVLHENVPRIVVRRRATLLEFADDASRQAAMNAGIEGAEVGDRFLLVRHGKRKSGSRVRELAKGAAHKFDYAQPLPPCVEARETGRLRLATPHPDLLIRGQLDAWAKRLGNDAWPLSEGSVRAAVDRDRCVDALARLLDARAVNSIPPFLQLALQAWAGAPFKAQLAKVSVLRCLQPDAFHAIAGAERHKGSLLGRLGPDTFLVDPGKLNELKKALRWAGIEIDPEIMPRKT